MLYWSTPPAALLQKLTTFHRLLYWEQLKWRITCLCFLLGFQLSCLSNVKDNCDKTKEKQPDVASLFQNWRKSEVRNVKRVWVWKAGFSSQSSSLVIFSPSLPFMVSVLCDLSARRVTWVLLTGLTPTDKATNLWKVGAEEAGNTCYLAELTLP